jgi:hypothetical protein
MKNCKTLQVKINKALPGYSEGVITTVVTDAKGVPLEKFWRDRFLDAKTDNCIEIIEPELKKKPVKEDSKS